MTNLIIFIGSCAFVALCFFLQNVEKWHYYYKQDRERQVKELIERAKESASKPLS